MELLECRFVAGSKSGGEFLSLVGLAFLQSLAGKREATQEPHQALGCRPLFLALFVFDQLFERAGESGGGVISGADFLYSVRWEGYE